MLNRKMFVGQGLNMNGGRSFCAGSLVGVFVTAACRMINNENIYGMNVNKMLMLMVMLMMTMYCNCVCVCASV